MAATNAKGHRANGAQTQNVRISTPTNTVNTTAPVSISQFLDRRFAAALRCDPLESGQTDPWPSNVKGNNVSVTDYELDGWAATIGHFLASNAGMPIVDIEIQRALWVRGGAQRRLIEALRARLGAAA